ncbi:MAG: FAD binding domain-containing protein [Treponema sp.]|nr:FAD binding domain-containing protein [Treponema sp.]
MDAPRNQIFSPSSLNELFSIWKQFPEAVPFAGGTTIACGQEKEAFNLPPKILCLDKLAELKRITRTERYLEIGSMVKLNNVIWLGKIVPEIITKCLENMAGTQLRNIATVGGNICCRNFDLTTPMIALDAHYELRSAQTSRWISASRFYSLTEPENPDSMELLTRIRVPLDQWDYAVYRKFKNQEIENSENAVFLMKVQKNILTDIRVIYKAGTIFRNKNGEAVLIGVRMPLARKNAADFIENWKIYLAQQKEISDFSKMKLLNLITLHVYDLCE